MVKYKRESTELAKKAQLSLEKEKRAGETYNTKEVFDVLKEMFHNKCYICENKNITSYEIEHFIPHKGNVELKYQWSNLFLSCRHCNQIKGLRYEGIIDCTKEAADDKIAFRVKDFLRNKDEIEIVALEKTEKILKTCQLLRDVYYGNTPEKRLEASNTRRELRKSVSKFSGLVRDYIDSEGEDKEDYKCEIKRELKNNSEYTAFKRWVIRDCEEVFNDFEDYLEMISNG